MWIVFKMSDLSEENTTYEGCLDFVLSPKVGPNDKMFPVTPPVESACSKNENRRGRPKAAMITNLILEGSVSKNGIRCDICSRVFPRDKSLQAHRRVHTGERPYSCDYPGCLRKFKQSGQLKTHQRLHTGERPFLCSVDGCSSRFTHANRRCTAHPNCQLVRSDDFALVDAPEENQSEEVKQWFFKYRAERREARWSDKKRADSPPPESGCGLHSPGPLCDLENRTPPYKTSQSRKSLFGPDSPRKREIPKKRWLRIASREQESLANLSRPTVLRHIGHLSSPPPNCPILPLEALPTPPSDRAPSPTIYANLVPTLDTVTSPLSSSGYAQLLPRRRILLKTEEDDLAVPLPCSGDPFNTSFEMQYHTDCY